MQGVLRRGRTLLEASAFHDSDDQKHDEDGTQADQGDVLIAEGWFHGYLGGKGDLSAIRKVDQHGSLSARRAGRTYFEPELGGAAPRDPGDPIANLGDVDTGQTTLSQRIGELGFPPHRRRGEIGHEVWKLDANDRRVGVIRNGPRVVLTRSVCTAAESRTFASGCRGTRRVDDTYHQEKDPSRSRQTPRAWWRDCMTAHGRATYTPSPKRERGVVDRSLALAARIGATESPGVTWQHVQLDRAVDAMKFRLVGSPRDDPSVLVAQAGHRVTRSQTHVTLARRSRVHPRPP